jgi:hypothetical protein
VANADVSVVRMLLKAGAQAHQKGKKYVSMCNHFLKSRARVSYISPLFLGRYFDRLYTPHPSEACQKFFKFFSIMEQIRMRAMGETAPDASFAKICQSNPYAQEPKFSIVFGSASRSACCSEHIDCSQGGCNETQFVSIC